MILGQSSFSYTNGYEWIKVGNYSSIASDCYFHHSDNHYVAENKKYVSTFNFKLAAYRGDITIGNDVWIGREVKVLSGVKIGDGAIIAAHSVVTKDIPPFAIVAGNPAVIKRFRFKDIQIEALLRIKWWEWEDTKVDEVKNSPEFEDIDLFIKKYDKN